MSDTPLTDAFIGEGNDGSYMTEGEIAMCDFARKLERQRNELLEALDVLIQSASPTKKEHPRMFAAWDQALAAIAKAKEPLS